MTEREGDALFPCGKNVAERMGLTDIPGGLDELREFAANYVERKFQYDDRNRRVALRRRKSELDQRSPDTFRNPDTEPSGFQ